MYLMPERDRKKKKAVIIRMPLGLATWLVEHAKETEKTQTQIILDALRAVRNEEKRRD